MRISCDFFNIFKMVTGRVKITVAMKYDIACGLLINIFRVGLGLF